MKTKKVEKAYFEKDGKRIKVESINFGLKWIDIRVDEENWERIRKILRLHNLNIYIYHDHY